MRDTVKERKNAGGKIAAVERKNGKRNAEKLIL